VEVYAGELVVGVDDHVPLRFLHLHTDVVVCKVLLPLPLLAMAVL
jgi:hypothetical protein